MNANKIMTISFMTPFYVNALQIEYTITKIHTHANFYFAI